MIKILNNYAGLGGNRKNWKGNIQVTAIENDKEIAAFYKKQFPEDKIIITDGHDYLLNHFTEYDFIWTSPPCPSHSRMKRVILQSRSRVKNKCYEYPDMRLYQEIILLKYYFKGLFSVENVIPYYETLIPGSIIIGRHVFWTNFKVYPLNVNPIQTEKIKYNDTVYGFNLNGYKFKKRKSSILRNLVNPLMGEHVLNCALKSFPVVDFGLFENTKV